MYNSPEQTVSFENQPLGIKAKVTFLPGAFMSLEFNQHNKEKNIAFKTPDFPVFAYHNSVARLTPIYNQQKKTKLC